MPAMYTQMFPPAAAFTEADLESQVGKTFVITGGYGGIGYELCQILYHAGGTVFLTGRSKTQGADAVERIKASTSPNHISGGLIEFMDLDMSDMTSIKTFAQTFKSASRQLDVLFNNAAIVQPPIGGKSPQGFDESLATNVLGPFLLTKLLLPQLQASKAPRVIWTASQIVDLNSPKDGIAIARDLETPFTDPAMGYTITKLANWYLAVELPRQPGCEKITSLAVNPGNLRTGAPRHIPWLVKSVFYYLCYEAVDGAYSNLWAGLSPEITLEDNGRYVMPFGRWHPGQREDLVRATVRKEDGGSGNAREVWEWCDKMTKQYA